MKTLGQAFNHGFEQGKLAAYKKLNSKTANYNPIGIEPDTLWHSQIPYDDKVNQARAAYSEYGNQPRRDVDSAGRKGMGWGGVIGGGLGALIGASTGKAPFARGAAGLLAGGTIGGFGGRVLGRMSANADNEMMDEALARSEMEDGDFRNMISGVEATHNVQQQRAQQLAERLRHRELILTLQQQQQ